MMLIVLMELKEKARLVKMFPDPMKVTTWLPAAVPFKVSGVNVPGLMFPLNINTGERSFFDSELLQPIMNETMGVLITHRH